MYALANILATLLVGVLYIVTSRRRWMLASHRELAFECVRYLGLGIVWGIIVTSLLAKFIPSPWS